MSENTHHRTPPGESQPEQSHNRTGQEPDALPTRDNPNTSGRTEGAVSRQGSPNPIDETGDADVRHGDLDELDASKRGIN